MPNVDIPVGRTGPNREPILEQRSARRPGEQVTIYGRQADISFFEKRVLASGRFSNAFPSASRQLDTLVKAGARVAVVFQYAEVGESLEVPDVPWVEGQTDAIGFAGAIFHNKTANGDFKLSPSDKYDVVLVLNAKHLFNKYGRADGNGRLIETRKERRTVSVAGHEILHVFDPLDHKRISAAVNNGMRVTKDDVLQDKIYLAEAEANYKLGIVLRTKDGREFDPFSSIGSATFVTLDQYQQLFAEFVADSYNRRRFPTDTRYGTTGDFSLSTEENLELDSVETELFVESTKTLISFLNQPRIAEIEGAGAIGQQFASILSQLLPVSNPFARVGASAGLGLVLENVAEAVRAGGVITKLPSSTFERQLGQTESTYNVLENVPEELAQQAEWIPYEQMPLKAYRLSWIDKSVAPGLVYGHSPRYVFFEGRLVYFDDTVIRGSADREGTKGDPLFDSCCVAGPPINRCSFHGGDDPRGAMGRDYDHLRQHEASK